jgi:hypothetical protein
MDVRTSPMRPVERADDYAANSLLAFALGGDPGSGLG